MVLTQERFDQIREAEIARLKRRQQLTAESVAADPTRSPYLWSPGVAAVLSLFIPGASQIYKQQISVGFIFMIVTGDCYFAGLIYTQALFVAVVVHIASVAEAVSTVPTQAEGGADSWSLDLPDHAQLTGLSPVAFVTLSSALIAAGVWFTK